MSNNKDTQRLINRISKFADNLDPKSKKMQAALHRVGMVLSGEMKVNITKEKIIDTGALRQNTTYKVEGSTVSVGTFGVPYAKYHEFGTEWSHKQWLFLGRPSVEDKPRYKKTKDGRRVVEVRGKGLVKESRINARPFVRPAVERRGDLIRQIIREASAP